MPNPEAIGKVIYLDREQCQKFETSYYDEEAEVTVAASTLIRTKRGSYDAAHLAILEPLGNKTLVLVRKGQSPGWFTIEQVV